MQKTVVIFNQFEHGISFFVHEGEDISHLNNKYIGLTETSIEEENELSYIFEESKCLHDFPVEAVRDGASVIVCGIIP